MKKLIVLVLLIHILLLACPSQAQEPVVVFWETDPPPDGNWTVGDPIPLRLRATYPADWKVTLPELSTGSTLPAQWGPVEVREQTLLDPIVQDNGAAVVVREATVILWSPGEHETPPFAIHYRDAGGELGEVFVRPLSINIASVLPESDGDQKASIEKHDLKPQASLPRPPVWPWLLLGIFVAALLYYAAERLLPRLRRRKEAELEALEPVDDRPPEIIAYEELDRITTLDLPAQNEFKRHYTLVTDCVRAYIEGVYQIPAMDRTTGELTNALRSARITGEPVSLIRPLLEKADLVKFAKLKPSVKQADTTVTQARYLVDITKPERTPDDDQAQELLGT
ncbi:MAG: hypothetical protein GY832_34880 [Chloroflexi bacterium]|nr:hypothetical protein [Chloroflexota bacterium]